MEIIEIISTGTYYPVEFFADQHRHRH